MAFKIYTKTGDKGATSLIGGVRVPKNHIRIEAYGTIDELNSHLGMVGDLAENASVLATSPDKEVKMKLPDLHEEDVTWLEQGIDQMNEQLPEMRSFILPGGNAAASAAHVARCVCRRAERICVGMQEAEEDVPVLVIRYLNRLSDYLFVLARYIGHINGAEEIPWRARL
jgi:cob(I)alamin adenosyltransferase